MKIGVDVGGTFTDFLLLDEQGNSEVFKVLSTPDDPSRAVFAGFEKLAVSQNLNLDDFLQAVEIIVHGTTVTTNAVLTGNIARTGLLTTRGFRDALQMRRGVREVQYDNKYLAPTPLVPRWLRLPVTGRIDPTGAVLEPLTVADVDIAVSQFHDADVEAVAICFLHSYQNDAHESAVAARIRELMPETYLSVSSQILPQVRFYERLSTTVLNAGVGPILSRYLGRLVERLEIGGYPGVLLVMQSNGGVTSPQVATQLAATTLLSGPAAAPIAGLAFTIQHDSADFITVDMGGTSFDAALVKAGTPSISPTTQVNRHALALESMDINTVGAGGGSIAWIDDGGLLRIGPQSAGAHPGPVCYGLGGSQPTCTDANLCLGYLSDEYFAGGEMSLDRNAARAAIAGQIAEPLGMSVTQAAHGIYHLINVQMASAIREITVQKGYDPRDFLLVCAGGAGPLHAAFIADELDIKRILVPRQSSIFCAAGMLYSDLKHDLVRSYHVELASEVVDPNHLQKLIAGLREEGDAILAGEHIASDRRRFQFTVDLRYLGQYHEVTVEAPIEALEGMHFGQLRDAFHQAHDRLYGYSLGEEGTAVHLVNLRLSAVGVTDKPTLQQEARRDEPSAAHLKGEREVFSPEHDDFVTAPVFAGDDLGCGHHVEGPAIIEQRNTTLWLPAAWQLDCDTYGSFLMKRDD